jgi:hypothetical protein
MKATIQIVARGSLDIEIDEEPFNEIRRKLSRRRPMDMDKFVGETSTEIIEQDLVSFLLYEVVGIEDTLVEEGESAE